jgi:DNA replication ATP-dependent helicase Dna2
MERSLREGTWDQAIVDERIDATVQESLGELVKLGIDVKTARREVKIRAQGLSTFAERYISDTPKVNSQWVVRFIITC